jgi:RNA polymerase sigma-70 factor (ECF subfamily)
MTDLADRLYRRLLILRCQAGDHLAFEELVAAYGPGLRYFLEKMLHESHAAEDLLQQVWLDVFRGVAGLADTQAFPAWLYRIARHRVFAESRRRRPKVCSVEEMDLVVNEETTEAEFTAEEASRLHAALDRLGPEHREILLLRYIEDLSYEEIARVTGCGLGTVKSRLHYAKRALRRLIERNLCHDRPGAGSNDA